MKYISTRGGIEPISFVDAVMMGLATDGGLLLPEDIPQVDHKLDQWRRLPFEDLAIEILSLFVGQDISHSELTDLIKDSYSTFSHPERIPITMLGDLYIMELFHGPTLAFKDVALQFLGNLFEHILSKNNQRLNILGATSGDTGSAAIYGVRGKKNMNIFILHPHKKVSSIQERQMTTVLDRNVFNIAIEGTFDDGQRIIKALFNDIEFKNTYCLGAVNSVNWARVAAQIVYYFFGVFRVMESAGSQSVHVCVPTGNFGNIFAGYLAKRMGAPISKLILATNENDILSRFFQSGIYRKMSVNQTLSPSMDIQIASNFERYLYYFLHEDAEALTAKMEKFSQSGSINVPLNPGGVVDPWFVPGKAKTEETLAVIKNLYQGFHYLIDPHSAVGVAVTQGCDLNSEPALCLATAHPAKFPEAIAMALGENKARHASIDTLKDLPTRCTILPAQEKAVRNYMLKHIK